MATKTTLSIITFLALCIFAFGQDSSYYTAIQKDSSVEPAQLKRMEESALKDYSKPESYELLATSFGHTTEKVWAVIYGEVYCNLSSDPDGIKRIGSLTYQLYERSLSRKGKKLSINLSDNSEVAPNQVPFELHFEISFLLGASLTDNLVPLPLTIQKLTAIRKTQLALWGEKELPRTALVRRQEAIASAGHFDAYNHWLFKSARPEEFNEWLKKHQTQFQAWLDWQSKNKFDIQAPDFQRLYMIRGL